jgi:t-SNARE complex subunit (syntaxin)
VEQDLDVQDLIIAEREEGIADIQKNMLEVRGMFQDLHDLVEQQAPLIGNVHSLLPFIS